MDPLSLISQDLFDKVRSRFKNLELGDESGNVTLDPREARFFDFDFVYEGNNLGRISISINERGTLKLFYGQSILENKDDQIQRIWFDFLKEMRYFAKRRLLRYDTRDITKSNLDKNDFRFLASKGSSDMGMQESRMFGSSRTSFNLLEKTKLIIRHNKKIKEDQKGSRSRNIESIFIENSEGERFKYPFLHLAGAKAMQRHVANGGRPHDEYGKKIIEMSEQIVQLNAFKRKVGNHDSMQHSANEIVERTNLKLESLRTEMANLCKQRYYEDWKSKMDPASIGNNDLLIDETTLEDYKNRFTVNSFNEELSQYFPLIYKIMKETSTVNLEDIVNETEAEGKYTVHCSQCGGEFKRTTPHGFSHCSDHKGMTNYDEVKSEKSIKEIAAFEDWAEKVTENKLTPDIVRELKSLLDSNLEIGLDGVSAIEALEGIGITDEELNQDIKDAGQNGDLKTVIRMWLERNNDQQAIKDLGIDQENNTPTTDKESEPKLKAEGIKKKSKKSKIPKDVKQMVMSFYNREEGNFPLGETGVLTKVTKELGEEAGKHASRLIKFLSKRNLKENSKMQAPNYDIKLEIKNPKFNLEDESELNPEEIRVGVNYNISGEYAPATWGYHGGEPPESPEIEIEKIVDLDSNEDLSNDHDVYSTVSDILYDKLEKKEIPEPSEPDYDDMDLLDKRMKNDDDFNESIDLIKQLSGIKK